MKTMAVGPFELVASCVTGGATTVAIPALRSPYLKLEQAEGFVRQLENVRRGRCESGLTFGIAVEGSK